MDYTKTLFLTIFLCYWYSLCAAVPARVSLECLLSS